jgi:hypothetical protein
MTPVLAPWPLVVAPETERRCPRCKDVRPVEEFTHDNPCRACQRKATRASYRARMRKPFERLRLRLRARAKYARKTGGVFTVEQRYAVVRGAAILAAWARMDEGVA